MKLKQLIIGLLGEGSTDYRFLNSIIKRTFEELAFECVGDVEIFDVQNISIEKSSFVEYIKTGARYAHEHLGIMILCIHTDADAKTDKDAFNNRIQPALKEINNYNKTDICKQIIPIVPITMTESWMLADEALFREEICTKLSLKELNVTQPPEEIADPKTVIKQAIQLAYKDRRRRKSPTISELYLPIGQKVGIEHLKRLSSYQKFYNNAREMLIQMKYIIAKS